VSGKSSILLDVRRLVAQGDKMVTIEVDMRAVGETVRKEIIEQLKKNGSIKSGKLADSFKIVVKDNEVEVYSEVEYADSLNKKKRYIFLDRITKRIAKNMRGA